MKADFGYMRTFSLIAVMTAVFLLPSSCRQEQELKPLLPMVEKALTDTNSLWFCDFNGTFQSSDISRFPIGMFSCGEDGFAILERFLTADRFDNITGAEVPDGLPDFAGEPFTYLLDYADRPYGDYLTDSLRTSLLRNVAVQSAIMMLGRDYFIIGSDELATGIKEPVKIILSLSDETGEFGFDDIDTLLAVSGTGVRALSLVRCGVDAVVGKMVSGQDCAIGIMDEGSILESGVYERLIREQAENAGIRNSVIQIFNQDCIGLEASVEGRYHYVDPLSWSVRSDYRGPELGEDENDIDVNMMDRYGFDRGRNALLCQYQKGRYSQVQLNTPGNYARYHLVSLIEKHRRSGSRVPIETVVLGNKAYHLMLDTLRRVARELYDYKRDGEYLYRSSISPDLDFVDPAECLFKNCYQLLRDERMLALNSGKSELSTYITIPSPSLPKGCLDSTETVFTEPYKFQRSIDTERRTVKMVPFSPRYLDAETFSIAEMMYPESMKLVKKKLY